MRLRIGHVPPLFARHDLAGRQINLAHHAGRWVLLSFYRAAACPLCSLRLWQVAQRYETYRQHGLDVIGVVESGRACAHAYLDRLRLPFPLLLDREGRLYEEYGVESSLVGVLHARLRRAQAYHEADRLQLGGRPWLHPLQLDGKWGRLPADFVLGPDLTLRMAYYGHDVGDFPHLGDLEHFVREAMGEEETRVREEFRKRRGFGHAGRSP